MGTVLDCILCFLLCQHWSFMPLIGSEELTSGCDLCRVATESERCDTVTLYEGLFLCLDAHARKRGIR